jgi:hypothetical protein
MRFEIIRVERLRSRHLPQEPALIKERPLKRNAPPKRGISVEMGMRIQTEGCSALGHDGRWRWIFANRSLADRILANRSGRRRRRLPARQIGSGGSAQHRKGCGRCGQNLQHDVAPLKVCTTTWFERSPLAPMAKCRNRDNHTTKKGDFNAPWFAFLISVA